MATIALKGKVIAPGVARGELCFITIKFDSPSSAENVPRGDVGAEIARFENKVVSVINELEEAVRVLQKDSFFEEGEDTLFCFLCGRPITRVSECIERGGHIEHSFTNPGGYTFHISCFQIFSR